MIFTNAIDELTSRVKTLDEARQYLRDLGDDVDLEAIGVILSLHLTGVFSPAILHRLTQSDWEGLKQTLVLIEADWTRELPNTIDTHSALWPDIEIAASRILLVRELVAVIRRRIIPHQPGVPS